MRYHFDLFSGKVHCQRSIRSTFGQRWKLQVKLDLSISSNSSKLWILSAQFLGPKSQRGGMRATQMALPNGQILTTPASLWLHQPTLPACLGLQQPALSSTQGQIGVVTPVGPQRSWTIKFIQKFEGNFIDSHEARPLVDQIKISHVSISTDFNCFWILYSSESSSKGIDVNVLKWTYWYFYPPQYLH